MNEGRKEFIELGRRFRELKSDAKTEETAFESYTRDWLAFDFGFDWNTLLEHRRVVVLGEPGSGKTWELQQRAVLLREQKQFAIFVRLDQLGTQPFSSALREEELDGFQGWLRNNEEGTFFLDSVDETKLRNISDFR
jgi:predicted NACHT family NTPase